MKTTLYNIKENYLVLMDEIEASEGVLSEEQETALDINKSELEGKSVAYLEVIRSSEAFVSTIDDEIKRLTALKKRHGNLIDKLKGSLLSAVTLFGEFTVGTLTFGKRKSESVIVEDINGLHSKFKTTKITESANKAELKKALKAGEKIEGVYVQTNYSLQTK
jgi:hypothetical protein